MWFLTRYDTIRVVQPQKKARGLKGQGSGKVKFGPVAEIYEFAVCFRIIFLMVKRVFFYLFDA